MTATLRIVLDQLVSETDADLAMAAGELARALIRTTPQGCEVDAIVPAGGHAADLAAHVPGLVEVYRAPLKRRELAASWQLGVAPGVGAGMIHSPSLMAPLVRHDRVHQNDQTVVTLWDLRAWEHPEVMSRGVVLWHKAMLKRAEKHADAIVVPSHAMASRLGELGRFGGRIRVISGAQPSGFAVPNDAVGRRRTLGLPEGMIVVAGPTDAADAFAAIAAAGVDLPVVVLGIPSDRHATLIDEAAAAGIPEGQVTMLDRLDGADRAAVLDGALAMVAPSQAAGFPWRAVEALALGVPVIVAASDDHHEILADGAVTGADAAAMGAALAAALGSSAGLNRLAVLAGDRGRAFSWREHADRVWALHAEL